MNHCAIYLKLTHHYKLTIFNFFFFNKKKSSSVPGILFLGNSGQQGNERAAKSCKGENYSRECL